MHAFITIIHAFGQHESSLTIRLPGIFCCFFRDGGNISILRGVLVLCSQVRFQNYITGINPGINESNSVVMLLSLICNLCIKVVCHCYN